MRISLRTLLVAIGVISVFLAIVTDRAAKQKAAVEWVLKDQRGHITYDYEWDDSTNSIRRNPSPPCPEWMANWIGIDHFTSVIFVILDCEEIDDVEPLTGMTQLRSLAIMNGIDPITDFSPLKSLVHLNDIYLDYTGIDETRLEAMRNELPNVRVVSARHPDPASYRTAKQN